MRASESYTLKRSTARYVDFTPIKKKKERNMKKEIKAEVYFWQKKKKNPPPSFLVSLAQRDVLTWRLGPVC